jgi:hypothetical protein
VGHISREETALPTLFPSLDPDGNPITVRYYSVDEIAPKLHTGRIKVRENCRRNIWPHLRVGGRYFMSDEQLAEVIEMMTVRPHIDVPDFKAGGPLGIVATPEETEASEGVR